MEQEWRLLMCIVIRVVTNLIRNKVKESYSITTGMYMKVNGKMVKWMAKVFTLIKTMQFIIKDNGQMVN